MSLVLRWLHFFFLRRCMLGPLLLVYGYAFRREYAMVGFLLIRRFGAGRAPGSRVVCDVAMRMSR